jgi:hypothetical protein
MYTIDGKLIASVYDGMTEAGKMYQKQINTGKLAAGIYIIHFQLAGVSTNKKLVLMK